jgi:hypothetical protein
MTQHILAINIKIKSSATCFGSLIHHQTKTIALVYSLSAHVIVHSINILVLCFVFGLMIAQ